LECHRLKFTEPGTADVDNLYARIGTRSPNFCFAGHTDVVPVGDSDAWTVDPFRGEIVDGRVYGRGAADMKGAVAAFACAVSRYLASHAEADGSPVGGSISLLITGDEEGPAINGTRKVLEWLRGRGEQLDACLVGEPTNPTELGEMIKIGRRGSLTGHITVRGIQGHTAYPHLADNAAHRLVRMLSVLTAARLDDGSEHFEPSTLQLTTVDVGNTAGNVIPGTARAAFNIRFNDLHTAQSLERWLRARFAEIGGDYELRLEAGGESFLSPPGPLPELVREAVRKVLGREARLSTTGGTSDARFIKDYCPTAEFGLVGRTMHKVDEYAAVADIEALALVYLAVLEGYFGVE
ncbi:MAG: succinyl-diaminopimelate desuccinylase, partial [Alphaproteobacteria bacterium]